MANCLLILQKNHKWQHVNKKWNGIIFISTNDHIVHQIYFV